MTAASSTDATVRRSPDRSPSAGARERPPAPRQPAAPVRPAPVSRPPAFDDDEDEFRLNLSDIPRVRESMDVEGLKPTLLSRLFDLVAPLKAS